MSIAISLGAGTASIASEKVGVNDYQQVKIVGGDVGSTSVMSVNPDGSIRTSIIGTVTVVNPAGSVAAISATIPAGSITTVVHPAASVTAVRTDSASVLTVQPGGSVIATFWGTAPSITGTYAEDAGHTSGDKGLFALAVRNDTLASITNADVDYSPLAVGPSGALTVHNAPITKWVQGTADLRVVLGSSVQAIAAQGASIFTYITAAQIANMGSASVLVTLTGGLGSILAYTIAPAGGGSNIVYPNALKTGENSGVSASLSGTASVLVSLQGFTAKI